MPYEERLERLEQVTWPKPHAEWIYDTFNAYATDHPWVQGEAIRPKSIARDMAERYASFTEYVYELRLQRLEGVLLRYLTQAYKTVLQSVPADAYTEPLWDVVAFLRAMLARVDSSLVTEWERMVAGDATPDEEFVPRPVDISTDKRAFRARIRAELHALVRALSREEWDEAAAWLRDPQDDTRPRWDAEALQAALVPFVEEFGALGFGADARLAWRTQVTPEGPHRWRVRQILVPAVRAEDLYEDPEAGEDGQEAEAAWSIEGVVDLTGDTNPEGPLVELIAIGE